MGLHDEHDENAFGAINRELNNVGDYGFVLIVASILDHQLELALERRLVAPHNGGELLLQGYNAPIGSFSSRIELAFRVGLIDPKTRDNLNTVRKIRNKFAHELDTAHLGSDNVRDLVDNLSGVGVLGYNEDAPDVLVDLADVWESKGKPIPLDKKRWAAFRGKATQLISLLMEMRNSVEPLAGPSDKPESSEPSSVEGNH